MLDFSSLKYHLEHSASLKLLRSDNLPLAVAFFYLSFKQKAQVSIPASRLQSELDVFLSHLNSQVESPFTGSPSYYLQQWADEDHRFLRKFYALDCDEPVFELTYETERVLEWLLSLEKKGFVGTESRFLWIIESLRNLAHETNQDPQERISELKRRREALDREIAHIEGQGEFRSLDSTQIRERFGLIRDEARRLVTDFRLVESNFREIAGAIKAKQLEADINKGDVLGYALDSAESLDESDQGKSFQSFWEFLRSDSMQEELNMLIEKTLKIHEVDQIAGHQEQDVLPLKKLKSNLLSAAQRVLESNRLFTDQLRRLLQEQSLAEHRLVKELIREIKVLCLEKPPWGKKDFVALEGRLRVNLPLDRPLFRPRQNIEINNLDLSQLNSDQTLDLDSLGELLSTYSVDPELLRKRIRTLLQNQSMVSLAQILKDYPPTQGLAEVVTYLSLAWEDEHATCLPDESELVEVVDMNWASKIRIPKVLFIRPTKPPQQRDILQ